MLTNVHVFTFSSTFSLEDLLTLSACAARVTVVSFSVCVCVCVCVCLSVTMLTATYLVYKTKMRYHRVLYDITDLQHVDFAKNASFKSYGVICLPPLPSTLSGKLSMDRRNSSEFFLRRRVCTLSDSFCRTTDSSLFSVKELPNFLAWPVHIMY